MKITEIEFGKHKNYVDENGNVWYAGFFELDLLNDSNIIINDVYYLQRILLMNFEEQVDWSKVEVDTPILVKQGESSKWEKRHFAKFEGGKVFAFHRGETSWSTTGNSFTWDSVKLGDKK